MSYLVLARKHRPRTFDELVGQEAVSRTLTNSIASGRLAHAYLFFGPRGVGKTTAARVLAKALNCAEGPTPAPCGKCPACVETAEGRCLDVLEIDAATHTQVDKIREVIVETVRLAPSRDPRKVFIIDEAHMLSNSAFNALLKTLEEPPEHVVFMLATTEPHKIPATIFSRCQRFRFRPIPAELTAEHLARLAKKEKIQADPAALELLARAGGGSLRDSLSLLDQAVSFAEGKLTLEVAADLLGLVPSELVRGALSAVLARDAAALWRAIGQAGGAGHDPAQLLRDLREALEALYLDRLGAKPLEDEGLRALAGDRPAEAFGRLLRRVQRTLEELRGSDAPQVTFELGLFGLLEEPFDLAEWVARLEALESRLGAPGRTAGPSSAPPAPPAPPRPAPQPAPRPAPRSGAEEDPFAPGPAAPAPSAELRGQGGAGGAPAPSAELRGQGGAGGAPAPAARTAPAAPKAPEPAAAPQEEDDGPPDFWRDLLSAVRRERPALAGYLESAAARVRAGRLELSFASEFHKSGVERFASELKKSVAAAAGRPYELSLRVDPTRPPPAVQAEPAPAEPAPAEAAELPWEDVESGAGVDEDPGVKRVLKVFQGKVRKPKE